MILAGVAGLLLFAYIFLRSSKSGASSGSILANSPPASGPGGGQSALDLSSGTASNLAQNLVPPNCPDGQVPQPTIINGGPGQPSFLLGWTCVPANSTPPPTPPTPTGDCPPGFHRAPIGLGMVGSVCLPDLPTISPPPAPGPVFPPSPPPPAAPPPPPAAKTITVCPWPSWCGSLWGIAQHFTGNGANWRDLYNANQGIIGGNPNLIKPGQVLTLPGGW